MSPGAHNFAHIPYYSRVLDRHIFSPERSLHSIPGRNSSLSVHNHPIGLDLPHSDTRSVAVQDQEGESGTGNGLVNTAEDATSISHPCAEMNHTSSHALTSCDTHAENKIPRPRGALGKPTGGGYSLLAILGWSPMDYKATQNLARTELNPTKSFKLQDPQMVEELCHKVSTSVPRTISLLLTIHKADEKFPILKKYIDRWATKDFVATFLKYSSLTARLSAKQPAEEPQSSTKDNDQPASSRKHKHSVRFTDGESQESVPTKREKLGTEV
ncbi:hypothetical protein K439DRAFT_1623339 [Ramaria rubella]|nr:hypothetical protein K439DRAFT_1623339 [Ramaria rubella]